MGDDMFRGPPSNIDGMISLKVDNLTYRTTVDDLMRIFDKFGKIGDIFIPRSNRGSRGFAFVRFLDKRDAEDAMHKLDGSRLDGRDIRIQMARYARPEKERGGRYGDRDRDDRRRDRRDDRDDDRRDRRRDDRDDDRDRRDRRSPERSRRSTSRERRHSRSPRRDRR